MNYTYFLIFRLIKYMKFNFFAQINIISDIAFFDWKRERKPPLEYKRDKDTNINYFVFN